MMDLPDWLDEPMLTLSHFTPTIWHQSMIDLRVELIKMEILWLLFIFILVEGSVKINRLCSMEISIRKS